MRTPKSPTPSRTSRTLPERAGLVATPLRRNAMTNDDTDLVQLVTRVPLGLRRRVKIHCVEEQTTLMTFVIEALRERLEAHERTHRRRGSCR